mmetsp:Transcript_8232/g.27353  ORF Transcript_8232/g.27353 Transcript_8232/m.27353 type:complete len:252 (-) Transcript_8232:262-1017(-)
MLAKRYANALRWRSRSHFAHETSASHASNAGALTPLRQRRMTESQYSLSGALFDKRRMRCSVWRRSSACANAYSAQSVKKRPFVPMRARDIICFTRLILSTYSIHELSATTAPRLMMRRMRDLTPRIVSMFSKNASKPISKLRCMTRRKTFFLRSSARSSPACFSSIMLSHWFQAPATWRFMSVCSPLRTKPATRTSFSNAPMAYRCSRCARRARPSRTLRSCSQTPHHLVHAIAAARMMIRRSERSTSSR